jgi:hypothetical protein
MERRWPGLDRDSPQAATLATSLPRTAQLATTVAAVDLHGGHDRIGSEQLQRGKSWGCTFAAVLLQVFVGCNQAIQPDQSF